MEEQKDPAIDTASREPEAQPAVDALDPVAQDAQSATPEVAGTPESSEA